MSPPGSRPEMSHGSKARRSHCTAQSGRSIIPSTGRHSSSSARYAMPPEESPLPSHEPPPPHTVRDIGDGLPYAVLDQAATVAAARSSVPAGGIGLLRSADGRLPVGVISFDRLSQLDQE